MIDMKRIVMLVAVFAFSIGLYGCEDAVVDPICQDNEELINGDCVVKEITCEEGFELQGEECVPEIPEGAIIIPDFYNVDFGDALVWSFENNVKLNISSDFNDDVEPNAVYSQSVEAGAYVLPEGELDIEYSRGYNPNGVIEVPDFTGQSRDYIVNWLEENNIGKYTFYNRFSELEEGSYIGYDVSKLDEREENLRRDQYKFYLSYGPVEVQELALNNMDAVRGVNLGGWFVLEGWMTPDLFNGVNGSDETVFMEQKENAEAVLEEHWATFIVEEDFAWLAEHGVEYVRLPIPWWYQGDGIYGDSRAYIHQAMQWANQYGIKVLLDLHTAPGCQNGFDNGGIAGVLEWPNDPANVALTIEKLQDITTDFRIYASFWGIEVLNEPGWSVDLGILQQFYRDAYDAIRVIDQDVWVGFHDGFRMYLENEWIAFFAGHDFDKVFFDIHLYQVFGDGWQNKDINYHLWWVAVEQHKAVHRYDGIVPTIVGEWSLGLQGNVYEGLDSESIRNLHIAFGNAQLNVYDQGMGWFFWNYKLDRDGYDAWSYKKLVESGIFPDDISTN